MTKRARMIHDYLHEGMSIREVAEKYGRTPGGLQSSFAQWGVKLPEEERRRRHTLNIEKARNSRSMFRTVWPDCPPEKAKDYHTLRRYYRASEAKAMLEAV